VTLDAVRTDVYGQDDNADEKADIVQVLIQHGADVTTLDNTHSAPLHLASSKGVARPRRYCLDMGEMSTHMIGDTQDGCT
jgi:hypothetical protein